MKLVEMLLLAAVATALATEGKTPFTVFQQTPTQTWQELTKPSACRSLQLQFLTLCGLCIRTCILDLFGPQIPVLTAARMAMT